MWRRTERASFEKKLSTRLSQEPCFGAKVNSKGRAVGAAARRAPHNPDACPSNGPGGERQRSLLAACGDAAKMLDFAEEAAFGAGLRRACGSAFSTRWSRIQTLNSTLIKTRGAFCRPRSTIPGAAGRLRLYCPQFLVDKQENLCFSPQASLFCGERILGR
jgi:hypothetical protein